MTTTQTTITLELAADGTTYGQLIDELLALDCVFAVALDLRTPSSASSPSFSVSFDDSRSARSSIADFFGCDNWHELELERQPVID